MAGQAVSGAVGRATGREYRDPVTGMEFVFVKGDIFPMGGNVAGDLADLLKDGDIRKAVESSLPVHDVSVSDFLLGKYEVTQEEWEKVMGTNPSEFKGPRRPVENVNWDDAQEFIRKLNAKVGKKYRLPTEAKWEYAARSGGKAQKWAGTSDLAVLGQFAWFGGNAGKETRPVGGKRPNGLGLYDMSGNVREWCEDWYGEGYYGSSPRDNPRGPEKGMCRVLRGGSMGGDPGILLASFRSRGAPDTRSFFIGFRLAESAHGE